MFNSVLTAFGKFFARSFWLGAFVPVATIAALHLLIAAQVFPRKVALSEWSGADSLSRLTVTALGLVVLAYAVNPFATVIRGVLDGQLLWPWLRNLLRRARFQAAYRAKREVEQVADTQEDYSRFAVKAEAELAKAAESGQRKASPGAGPLEAAELEVEGLRATLSTGSVPDLKAIEIAAAMLESLLKTTSSAREEDALSLRLSRLHRNLLEVTTACNALFDTELSGLRQRWRLRWAVPAAEATGMGDARTLTERYSDSMYGVNFDYVWPRLQLALDPKSKEAETLEAAQTQIEFAVLSLALSLTIPLVWLPLLAIHGESLWLIIGVGLFGPFSWTFFYLLALHSQVAFGGVVQAIIDRNHLALLEDMHVERPPGTSEERELWGRLQAGDQGGAPSILYAKPPPPAPSSLLTQLTPRG